MWEAVEAKAGKIRVGKTKERREERGIWKEMREKRAEKKRKEKTKERKNNESKEDSRRVGDLEQGGGGSKIGGRSKKASTRKVSQVNLCFWQKGQ